MKALDSRRVVRPHYIVVSGGRYIGPFDGVANARRFVNHLRKLGVKARRIQLWSEEEAAEAMKARFGNEWMMKARFGNEWI
jgi:hypothetical protein